MSSHGATVSITTHLPDDVKPAANTYDPKNWIRLLLDVPRSRVFRLLALDVAGAGVYAALVVYFETNVIGAILPLGPSFLSILGIILGLLLVFRTNTAYDRWWEGRRLWGQLVNVSRGLAHQLDAMLASAPTRLERRQTYASLLSTFPASLARHLRAPGSVETAHAPLSLITALHREVHDDLAHARLATDARITIPVSYSTYVKQFVLVYAIVMPFGLVKDFGYGAVVASMLTFFATMGLELLAEEIENPFGEDMNDLPLDAITATITRDVHAVLGVPVPESASSAS